MNREEEKKKSIKSMTYVDGEWEGNGSPGVTMGGQCLSKSKESQKVTMAQGITNPRLLPLKDAGAYLGRTSWGMRELFWAKKIPWVRDGKKIFFDVRDLDKYIQDHKVSFE